MIITIDGPALSGKSTAGKKLAQKLDAYYLYSGLLFRAAGYIFCIQAGYSKETVHKVTAEECDFFLNDKRFGYVYNNKTNEPEVYFDKKNITSYLLSEQAGEIASCIGVNSFLRTRIKHIQHSIAEQHTLLIVDGRDAGSAVFPSADYSFYITAATSERINRLKNIWKNKKENEVFSKFSQRIIKDRDVRDSNRKKDPLIKPKNAIEIDTTSITKEQVVQLMYDHIK